uniref:Uncharacterized protein n=1 Tax=Phlegmariurus squarrosus TaxID=73615 RepID=H9M8C8_PHLSQ|nr:hypothetical protein HusqMp138 [Phlegmariurus squarrosus]AEV55835.1 hypothetical protein HusqMp138 [Phlegmariurus squarrosus]
MICSIPRAGGFNVLPDRMPLSPPLYLHRRWFMARARPYSLQRRSFALSIQLIGRTSASQLQLLCHKFPRFCGESSALQSEHERKEKRTIAQAAIIKCLTYVQSA